MRIATVVALTLLILGLAGLAFMLSSPSTGVASVEAQGIYQASGASTAASGTITSEVVCTLSFPASRRFVILDNRTGRIAYVKFNDIVSETDYDKAIDNGEDLYISGWLGVYSITVLITPATGVTPVTTFNGVGW